ncbi:hypothetical protein [Pseudomonas sp. B21-048]|uniref:hypothetical protein n=1 Tax=Pseudomonas sp. B21-048 TaxID=2895490 RepID=UPI00215F9AC6|nr:hypothetical protein [Pseudomonas sp. B21-048]UVL00506.1 hypothetical protein LOY56_09130 [Pseudomonas sp. B21-048]
MKDLADKISERNELLAKRLSEMVVPYLPAINAVAQQFGQWLTQVQTDLAPYLEKLAQIDWKADLERLENLPARSQEATIRASERGWFFNWQNSLQDTLELIDKLGEAGAEEVDAILKEHFTADFDWYTKLITDMYPARKNAIEAAANAHKRGGSEGYYLSIPVFLAQTDGIFSEITGLQQPMGGSGGKIRGSTYVSDEVGDNQDAKYLLHQVINLSSMSLLKSQGQRDKESIASGKTFNALNRHQVIHGEVSDYGTELNSLKAFSFLIYIAAHVPETLKSARLKKSFEPSTNQ